MKRFAFRMLTVVLAAIFTALPLHPLDFTDALSRLSDAFSSLANGNEGTSSFRSLLIPSGGRAESLGTAFTGLADDISCIEYNPASSATLKQTELAAFHNAWIADAAMETVAATMRKGNIGFGGQIRCFYVPFTEYNSFGERVAGSYYTETTAIFNISYNFLAGYYFKGIALGINAKASWRGIPDYADNNTGAIISGSGLSQSALAVAGDFGMMLQFNAGKLFHSREPNLRIGVNILNAGVAFTGFKSASGVVLDDALPTSAAIGISYRIVKPLLVTAEFRQPFNMLNISEYAMWSAGAGVEVRVTNFFSVLGGFLLKGANPRISLGSEFTIFKKITLDINYTLDLTSSLNPVNRISLCAKVPLGDNGRAETQKRIDELYNAGLQYFSEGAYDNAIACWEAVLKIDKRFDPARESIKSAQAQLSLMQKIQDVQRLE